MNARQAIVTPFSLMTVGLLMVLLATLLVFQSEQVSTAPADTGMTSMFEPKSGELIMDQAPYVGGILAFIIALLNRIFKRIFGRSFLSGAAGTAGSSTGPGVLGNTGSNSASGTSDTGGQTQTVQSEPAPEPEPAPQPQSLAQRIKCNVFGALGRPC